MRQILIIDDEISICDSLTFLLEDSYEVFSSQNPAEGMEIIKENEIDVVLLDLKIGKYNGLEVLESIKKEDSTIQVIMMTAYGSIQSSVEAMKRGATHYITKPLDSEELLVLIDSCIKMRNLSGKISNLEKIFIENQDKNLIIGKSSAIKEILNKVDKVKDLNTNVLITGESGTGKDLIAKLLHFNSHRSENNLEIVNCAAIPSDLLESELFGYEKGAFTGAEKKKTGRIEMAHNGTIFLDEIGEMDFKLQSKILRVLEDMEIQPLGGEKKKKVNVRIVAATNRDLTKEVSEGNFREDLYYRLNVVKLDMPPLRERLEDMRELSEYFVHKYSKEFNKKTPTIDDEVIKSLSEYSWPGNIRELQNLIERIMVFNDDDNISIADLPNEYLQTHDDCYDTIPGVKLGMTLAELEKIIILKTLEANDGSRKNTAKILDISERNLQYKLKEYLK